MRLAARTDTAKADIVKALRKAGAFTWDLRRPVDLLVFYRQWHLLEVKTGTRKRKDQPEQEAFCKTFGVPIVRSADDALRAIGAIR